MAQSHTLIKIIVLNIIKIYQATLSKDHGRFSFMYPTGYCRFKPTCSEYVYEAIEKHGVIKGGLKGCWRVFRCHPFSKGGWDPVDKHEAASIKQ